MPPPPPPLPSPPPISYPTSQSQGIHKAYFTTGAQGTAEVQHSGIAVLASDPAFEDFSEFVNALQKDEPYLASFS